MAPADILQERDGSQSRVIMISAGVPAARRANGLIVPSDV
jgi:hypothetical protein